jgi:mannose-6-phosphate isomerase
MIITNKPWGSFEVLLDSDYCKVKRIIVKPNQQLSYQYHNHRNELWVIVKGESEVIIDDISYEYNVGDSVSILKNQKHRVKNIGTDNLVFIETQYGESFDEDDIIRLEDNYGRVYN